MSCMWVGHRTVWMDDIFQMRGENIYRSEIHKILITVADYGGEHRIILLKPVSGTQLQVTGGWPKWEALQSGQKRFKTIVRADEVLFPDACQEPAEEA